jgi:thioredoxin-like negative regulator of GroEL
MGSCFSSSEPSPALKTSAISSQIGQDSSLPLNPYMNKMHDITTQEEFDRIMNDKENINVLIVCDFYAVWCPPCLRIAPTLHKWALNEYKTNVIFMKIDVDKNSDLSNLFSVSVLPTFVFFKHAKEIYRSTGGDSANLKQEIDKFK